MEAVPLPIPEDVRDLLADLTNKVVIVDSDRQLDPTTLPIVARYIGDNDELLALSCWDVACAAITAGAFAMIPKPVVEECVANQELDELVAECFHEVANIASRWLHRSTTPHLRLAEIHNGWREDELALLEDGRSRGYVLNVEGYGDGRAACVALGKSS
jgi:hypothetical protein